MLNTIKMVKKENGTELSVQGNAADIMCDLSLIARHVYQAFVKGGLPKTMAKTMVRESIDTALMTEAELKIKAEEALKDILEKLRNSINEDEVEELERLRDEIQEEVDSFEAE